MKFLLRNCEASNGIEQAVRDLLAQRHRHDVLENCLRELEEDESIDAVGYGGAPNILGEMELDASFMDGNNRSVGAVAAVQKFLPIKKPAVLWMRDCTRYWSGLAPNVSHLTAA
ncbi:isoaspartyl peptidase/L-asparaginase [Bradyrhizobium sp. AZCC 2289]|uniref:isoaspartyl peptidase/L-asparaginase n=1 Tax=Bradyrhizobium sp. AZCC 2289 TaxID=3117026 RepID=UPI002FEF2E00